MESLRSKLMFGYYFFKETCFKVEILCSFLQNSEKKSHKFDFKRILPRNLLKN